MYVCARVCVRLYSACIYLRGDTPKITASLQKQRLNNSLQTRESLYPHCKPSACACARLRLYALSEDLVCVCRSLHSFTVLPPVAKKKLQQQNKQQPARHGNVPARLECVLLLSPLRLCCGVTLRCMLLLFWTVVATWLPGENACQTSLMWLQVSFSAEVLLSVGSGFSILCRSNTVWSRQRYNNRLIFLTHATALAL